MRAKQSNKTAALMAMAAMIVIWLAGCSGAPSGGNDTEAPGAGGK